MQAAEPLSSNRRDSLKLYTFPQINAFFILVPLVLETNTHKLGFNCSDMTAAEQAAHIK